MDGRSGGAAGPAGRGTAARLPAQARVRAGHRASLSRHDERDDSGAEHAAGGARTHGTGARRVDALVDVDLDVMPGEMVAITGRSGSGKSTLLNLAGGLDQPTTGSVHVDRANLGDLSTSQLAILRRQTVGYVFQEFNLLPTLSAVENVALPLELVGYGTADDAAGRRADRGVGRGHRGGDPQAAQGAL